MLPATELAYFIEVANAQNLSRAADKIGISQPSLSLAIKRLEENIGVPLLIRHKRGVTLTQTGKQLYLYANKLKHDWDDARSQALAAHVEVQGKFVIGCPAPIGLRYLSTFIPALLNKYPKLEIEIKNAISRQISESVINLSIDIGIAVNAIRHPDLIITKLNDDAMMFWQAARGAYQTQALESNRAVIVCNPALEQTQHLLKELAKKKFKSIRLLPCESMEIIADLTAHGAGIGIIPESIAKGKKLKAITHLPHYNDQISLIYRHENRDISGLQTIIKAIKTNG